MPKVLALDLGSVLVDVDKSSLIKSFNHLNLSEEIIASIFFENDIFNQLYKGQLDTKNYLQIVRQKLQAHTNHCITPSQVEIAFCSMVSWRKAGLKFLDYCHNKKQQYIFWSNINPLHISELYAAENPIKIDCLRHSPPLKNIYSYELGYLKPEIDFYKKALKVNSHKNSDVFFIDDKKENIQMAHHLGINSVQLYKPTFKQLLEASKINV